MNQTLKMTLTKLTQETKMNRLRCLPLALLKVRTKRREDIGIYPYEMMFGLPFLTTLVNARTYEGELGVRKYIQTITSISEDFRKKGYLPQTIPTDFKTHNFQPGDWVFN